jgi:hypothetical protein
LAGAAIVPVSDAVMFSQIGGQVIAGTTPDGAQSQILTYTGIQAGGVGTLVGIGIGPASAPVLTAAAGAGIDDGTHSYASTFVTPTGESLPSPTASSTTGIVANPTSAPFGIANVPNGSPGHGSFVPIGDTLDFQYAYSIAASSTATTARTLPSPTSASIVTVSNGDALNPTSSAPIRTNVPYSTDPRVLWVHLYLRSTGQGAGFRQSTQTANNPAGGTWTKVHEGGGLPSPTGTQPAGVNTAITNQVTISSIPIGSASVTQRKLYRTAIGSAQLKLLTTIADNTTTTYLDATADASLGANAPTGDTSGLTQLSGQVNAGATTLPVAGTGAFSANGGWALIAGSQVISYTGVTSTGLVGIPASGAGAIVSSVSFNSTVTAAPALTGVSGVLLPMQKGAMVHIWVQRDDLGAQSELIALDAAQGRVSDGIVEHTITDERRGETSLIALCDADLALFSRPIVTVMYATRDTKTKSGKPITITLTSPPISDTLTIQSVDISEIDIAYGLAPRFSVVASNVRFSLEDLLRRMAVAVGA